MTQPCNARSPLSRAATLALAAVLLALAPAALAIGPVRIDDNDRVVAGYVHHLATPANRVAPAALDLPMERMILSLQRRPGADAEIDALLARQQDPSSPDYHHWLTPEEFGQRFGISDESLGIVVGWLQDNGFAVEEVAAGRGWINFSGDVSQVERAFRTEIHEYLVDGAVRHANSVAPTMPRALAGYVHGVVSLHSFPRQAMNAGFHPLSPEDAAAVAAKHAGGIQPEWTGTANGTAGTYLGPTDWAKVYDASTSYSSNGTGTGVVIGIVGRTNPGTANWATFRSTLGLPVNTPTIVINGTNPGDAGAAEDGEADLDAEWSGGTAPGATVKFVASKSTSSTDGVDLSAQYIVNNNLAPVMSTSFGQCESSMGSTENTFYNNLWSQAATAGITSFVSTGDSGAAGCTGGNSTSGAGYSGVNGLASTPYNVAVGATQLSTSSSYWSGGSPTGYIPETPWNESGSVSGGSGLWSTSSGASSTYAKPSWQAATGVPSTSHRYLPDVSVDGSDMFFGNYGMLCYSQGSMGTTGGTSASSPSYAGIMALIVQKYGRQGNANVKFYQLGQAQFAGTGPAVYHDITSGNNNVPGLTGFTATTAWDEVSGLGTPDVTALVNNWGGSVTTYSISGNAGTTGALVSTGSASATSDASSNYSINSLAAGSYTVTPSKSGCTFTPASSSVTISTANVTGVNFTASCTTPTYSISGSVGTTGATVTAGSSNTTSDASSNYTMSGFAAGTYTVTPSKSGCTFSPASSSVTITSANVTANFTASCGTGDTQLTSGVTLSGQSVAKSAWKYYYITVPAGATNLTFATTAATADIDIYTLFNAKPTLSSYTCRPYTSSGNESCSATNPSAGTWWLGVYGYAAGSYSVTATVTTSTPTYSISGSAGTATATVTAGTKSATSDSSNNYSIAGLANGTYTVTPSKSGCTFSPASTSVTVSSANVTGINFTATCTGPTTLFSDGFELGGWSTAQVSGTAGAWTFPASGTHPTQAPHGGTKLAVFNSYTSASGSQTRVYRPTGFAVASSFTTVSLKFWMYHDTGYSTYADKVQAQVSTNGTTWTNVGTAVARYTGSTGWTQASIDLSAYKGQTVYLAFVGQSAYGNDEYLDDITVTAQ